jgi:hypothetical protein
MTTTHKREIASSLASRSDSKNAQRTASFITTLCR